MSVISSRSQTLSLSSILKTPNAKLNQTPKYVRFVLPDAKKIRTTLQNFINREGYKEYEELVCLIRDSDLSDDDLRHLLTETRSCISLLNENVRHFVEALLIVKWAHRSKHAVKEYQSFLLDLLSAHNYHAKFAINELVSNFLPDKNSVEWINGEPSKEDYRKYLSVHYVISFLLKMIPMSHELVLPALRTRYPYLKKSAHCHECYVTNLLWVLDYQSSFRLDILMLIADRLVLLDVNAPRSEIEETIAYHGDEEMEVFNIDGENKNNDEMKHPIAHSLDVCMERLFKYSYSQCHDDETKEFNWEGAKTLYNDMIKVMDEIILRANGTFHVQFIMFYLCSFKTTLAEAFLNYLWKKSTSLNLPPIHRQASVSYVGGLLARAAYIPLSIVKSILEEMVSWIHLYITNQEVSENVVVDVRRHMVFYSVCQMLFYVIAFRHHDLTNGRKNLVFLQSLNLTKIVTCQLNPLRVCYPAIVQNFAAVTRTYQLAYCYSIIERNQRNNVPVVYKDETGNYTEQMHTYVETCFPFDPYLLYRSGKRLEGLYLEYQSSLDCSENCETVEKETEDADDEDDFLCDSEMEMTEHSMTYGSTDMFSYSTSPGFKH